MEKPNCTLCGEPMPEGEEMFHYHGYSGPCPKPPQKPQVFKQADIDNWFSYHAPTQVQQDAYMSIRNRAKELAETFNTCAPPCSDTTAAMRHLREAVMAMNQAIACN